MRSRRKILGWTAIGVFLLLVAVSAMSGFFPRADSPRTANPEYWYGRIGATAMCLAVVIGFAAAAAWLWNSTRTPDQAQRLPARERVRAVLRRIWVALFGMYALYFLYAGISGARAPGDDVHSRVLWVALCLSSSIGFGASALWIHRRGTPRARPWSEGLRNALSWALTWLLGYFSFGFLLSLVIPHHHVPDQTGQQRLALSAIYVVLAAATGAAAVWVRRKTRPRPTTDTRTPATAVGDRTEIR